MKCVLRKLGVVIDNDNLQYLNGVKIEYDRSKTGGTILTVNSGSTLSAKVISAGNFVDSSGANLGREIIIPKSSPYETQVNVSSDVTSIVILQIENATSFQYSTFTTSQGPGILKIDIDDFEGTTNLATFSCMSCGTLMGSILSLASNLKLGTLWVKGSNYPVADRLEDFVEKQWKLGRRSGALSTRLMYTTLNGASVPFATLTYSNSGCVITNTDTSAVLATFNGTSWVYE